VQHKIPIRRIAIVGGPMFPASTVDQNSLAALSRF
jgi:hypothetical protein